MRMCCFTRLPLRALFCRCLLCSRPACMSDHFSLMMDVTAGLSSFQVYTVGTILSMQISFVGFQPVQSSEHMAVSVIQNAIISQNSFEDWKIVQTLK